MPITERRAQRRGAGRLSPALLLAISAGVLAVAGVGYAAIPSADGAIHTCYNASANPSGSLRVIDAEAGAKCTKNEKPLTLNQRGPQGIPGLPGAEGPRGLQGETGPAGPAVASTATIVRKAFVGTDGVGTEVLCPAGRVATGGGYRITRRPVNELPEVYKNQPIASDSVVGLPVGWEVTIQSSGGGEIAGDAYVICAA